MSTPTFTPARRNVLDQDAPLLAAAVAAHKRAAAHERASLAAEYPQGRTFYYEGQRPEAFLAFLAEQGLTPTPPAVVPADDPVALAEQSFNRALGRHISFHAPAERVYDVYRWGLQEWPVGT